MKSFAAIKCYVWDDRLIVCSRRNLQLKNVHDMIRMQVFKISSLEYLAQNSVCTEQAEEIVLLDSSLHKTRSAVCIVNLTIFNKEISCMHRELNDLDYAALVTAYAVYINPGTKNVKGF